MNNESNHSMKSTYLRIFALAFVYLLMVSQLGYIPTSYEFADQTFWLTFATWCITRMWSRRYCGTNELVHPLNTRTQLVSNLGETCAVLLQFTNNSSGTVEKLLSSISILALIDCIISILQETILLIKKNHNEKAMH